MDVRRAGILAVAVLALAPVGAAAQSVEAGPVRVDVGGRVQVQFNTTDLDGEPFSTFETRRIRAAFELEIEEWITGKVEPDFAGGGISLKDAWVNLDVDPRFQLKAGHFKKPFSLIELTSSTKLLSVERGLRLRGVSDVLPTLPGEAYELLEGSGYLGRDLGTAVHGRFGPVSYMVGAFNGNGGARDADDAKSYAGRLTLAPLADLPLTVSGAFSHSHVPLNADATLDGLAFEVDAEWGGFREPGLHVQAEVMTGDNLGLLDAQSEAVSMMGANVAAGWFFPVAHERVEGFELVSRVSYGDPDRATASDEGVLLTPGMALYFHGRNRFQVNWDAYVPSSDALDVYGGLVAQLQMYF